MVKRIKCTILRSVPLAGNRWSGTEPAGPANISIVKAVPSTDTALREYTGPATGRGRYAEDCPAGPYEKLYEIPHGLFLDVLA